jgi:aminoglycoside 2'-N-acetyltransferase I
MRSHYTEDPGEQSLQLICLAGDQLDPTSRRQLIDLCARAYEEEFTEIMDTFQGCVHVLGYLAHELVSHALWVTRWLQVGEGPLLRTAYVEAVATEPSYQNRGYASAVMRRIAAEIATDATGYDLAALSPFSIDWYARLDWEQWTGPLSIRTAQGLLRTPDEDGHVMILRLPKTPPLDLAAPLSAEWRVGELW